jgi:2-methylcitrate dehydratase PrpD
MISATETIAKFIFETNDGDIPKEAFRMAKKCFVDTLGVALAGSKQLEANIIGKLIRNFEGKPESGVIASDFKTSVPLAALANGVMAHALDYDDMSTKFLAHPSANLVPAILALGESQGISGEKGLTSYIIGYEVGANLGSIMGMTFFGRGWHATSILGSVGTAAAAAKILGLGVQETRMALGIAASLAGGLKINFGTMTKPLHVGIAAQNGILAAMLAQKGFAANANVFDGPNGFCEVYTGTGCELSHLEETIGKIWYIVSPGGVKFKPYPCCGSVFGCADAILELKRRHHILPKDVSEIECRLSPLMLETGASIHSPMTGQEGRFSLEYDMAIAIIDGELSLGQYTDEKVKSPEAQELMKKVRVTFPKGIGMGMEEPQEVVVKLKNGRQYSFKVEKHKGTPENPLSDDELFSKFKDCASLALNQEGVDEVLNLLWRLDEMKNISRLMELLTFGR